MQSAAEVEVELEAPAAKSVSRLRDIARLIRKNRGAMVGGSIVLAFILISIVVTIANLLKIQITPFNPIQPSVGPNSGLPTAACLFGAGNCYFFGTDNLGRDVFSRVIAAVPNDAEVSFAVIAFALAVGGIIGAFAAFRGGLLDEALMRLTDVFFALPALILAMAIAVALGAGLTNMMIALMVIWWPPYARLARGETLKVSHQNFIEASRLSGLGTVKVIFKHVIPNISLTLLVYATLDIGTVILTYSGLSFLGLSVRPPAPDLGYMVSQYRDYMLTAFWLPFFPGLIIALKVIGFSVFGDGLRDALEAG